MIDGGVEMRGRPFRVDWREGDSPERLRVAYQRERDIEVRTRLHGLWLLRSGRRLSTVAEIVGVHYRTVQTWVDWYRAGGVAEVVSHRLGGKGREPLLAYEAHEELAQEVATGRFRTAREIRDWIKERYGVSYTESGAYQLVRRLRCSPKVPRPIHTKADAEQQASWKKGGSKKPLWKVA